MSCLAGHQPISIELAEKLFTFLDHSGLSTVQGTSGTRTVLFCCLAIGTTCSDHGYQMAHAYMLQMLWYVTVVIA